jgi:TRAP-type C4-dicarboxylate transport system permease small subunit
VIAVILFLGTWDGLYGALDLPQALPALTAQLGGAGMLPLAYLRRAPRERRNQCGSHP